MSGKESSYFQSVEYDTDIFAVTEMIYVMENCRQYISWECRSAIINNDNRVGVVNTGWYDRDENMRYYWGVNGSAVAEDDYDRVNVVCACGLDHTCAGPDLACNCDSNSDEWEQDDGYLTYKPHLPVTKMVFGDTGKCRL